MIDLHIRNAGELPEILNEFGIFEFEEDSGIDFQNGIPYHTKDKGYFYLTTRSGTKFRIDFEFHEPFTL